MYILKWFLSIVLILSLTACSLPPLPMAHEHTKYIYGISYGKSPDKLDSKLIKSCEVYFHSESYSKRNDECPSKVDTIEEYTCALDGFLYLSKIDTSNNSIKSYSNIPSVVKLDTLYCKVDDIIVEKIEYVYNFQHDKDTLLK